MTGTILPPDRLRNCTRALANTAATHGQTEAVERRELEPLVASALIGPVACDEYLAALAAAFGETPSEQPVTDLPSDVVLRDGLSALSDELFFRLARSPSAIRDLNRLVEGALTSGTVGPYWIEAELLPADVIPAEYHAAAANAVEQFRRLERETRPRTEIRTRRWVKAVLPFALAASLLIAFYLGTRWAGDKPGEVRLASLAVRGEPARGIGTIALDVQNASDRRAFVTVVGLIPGRSRPVYHYRSEGRYLDAPPQTTTAVTNLPPEFEGTTVLVVFLTRVPAGEAVREAPSAASRDSAEEYAAGVRKALTELGIDADSKMVPLPSAAR